MNSFYFSEFIIRVILLINLFIFQILLYLLSPFLLPILLFDLIRNKNTEAWKHAFKEYFILGYILYKEIS